MRLLFLILILGFLGFTQNIFSDDNLRGQKACDKLSTTDAYKSCKVLSVKLHATSSGSASYQVQCNCLTKKGDQPITVTVNMGMY